MPDQAHFVRIFPYLQLEPQLISMGYSDEVETLADIFPTIPKSDLAARFLCTPDLDKLIEELFAEEHAKKEALSQKHSSDIRVLQRLFPGKLADDLAREFQKNAYNLKNTMLHLLVSNEAAPPPPRIYDSEVHKLKEMFPHMKLNDIAVLLEENNHDIDVIMDILTNPDPDLDRLCRVTGLKEDVVRPYLRNSDFLRALVNIMSHVRPQKKTWNSRVQDRNTTTTLAYVYHDESPEAVELRDYVTSNLKLQNFSFQFLQKCLCFYCGDVYKVLEVAHLFGEGKEHLTFEKGDTRMKIQGPKAADVLKIKYNYVPAAPQIRLPPRKEVTPEISLTVEPKPVPQTIDLHGYSVAEAVRITKKAVEQWWKKEMDTRMYHGMIHKHGPKVDFVEPINVVTGRGIHSSGGPKIRGAVIKMLNLEGYMFLEGVGSVSVVGKKKS